MKEKKGIYSSPYDGLGDGSVFDFVEEGCPVKIPKPKIEPCRKTFEEGSPVCFGSIGSNRETGDGCPCPNYKAPGLHDCFTRFGNAA
jgi:hypothetical protein